MTLFSSKWLSLALCAGLLVDAAPQGTQDEANVAPVYQGSTDATSLDLSNTYTDFDAAVEAARVAPSGDEVDDPSNLKAPDGYDLIFGPLSRANNAPGYMGFVYLEEYDVGLCAAECNKRHADHRGGSCRYFNIWRGVIGGDEGRSVVHCAMYYLVHDQKTATNTGQGDLVVTRSRGYRRKHFVVDGGFEAFSCGREFCYGASYAHWIGTSPPGGNFDASIFHYTGYAHIGTGVALLGSGYGADALPGTLTIAKPLDTIKGRTCRLEFFHASKYSSPERQKDTFVEILWNGQVHDTIRPGYSDWKLYSYELVAAGKDVLAFRGGKAPAYSFIDDVSLFSDHAAYRS